MLSWSKNNGEGACLNTLRLSILLVILCFLVLLLLLLSVTSLRWLFILIFFNLDLRRHLRDSNIDLLFGELSILQWGSFQDSIPAVTFLGGNGMRTKLHGSTETRLHTWIDCFEIIHEKHLHLVIWVALDLDLRLIVVAHRLYQGLFTVHTCPKRMVLMVRVSLTFNEGLPLTLKVYDPRDKSCLVGLESKSDSIWISLDLLPPSSYRRTGFSSEMVLPEPRPSFSPRIYWISQASMSLSVEFWRSNCISKYRPGWPVSLKCDWSRAYSDDWL
jgi:hypothetical protein